MESEPNGGIGHQMEIRRQGKAMVMVKRGQVWGMMDVDLAELAGFILNN